MGEELQEAVAEVRLHVGRWYLVVHGVYVAAEGDPWVSPEPWANGQCWTKQRLDQAAHDVNTNPYRGAATRNGRGAF